MPLPMGDQGALSFLSAKLGSGDCIYYEACPHGSIVLNLDGYSMKESRPPYIPVDIWAWRAVLGSIMDVVATAARPQVVSVSIGVSSSQDLYEATYGAAQATLWAGALFGKSDSNLSSPGGEWIDVAVLGSLDGPPIPRLLLEEASEELRVVQIGYTGYGLAESRMMWNSEIPPPYIVKRKPPVNAWRVLRKCGALSSSDNSDGAGYTLKVMAVLSRLDIHIERFIVDPRIPGLGDAWEISNSWEDYNLFVIATGEQAKCIELELDKLGIPGGVIGWAGPGDGRVFIRGEEYRGEGWNRKWNL